MDERIPYPPFSDARARDFIRDANKQLDEPLDFATEHNKDVAMALVSGYLEYYTKHSDVPKQMLGGMALDYLSVRTPSYMNRRWNTSWDKADFYDVSRQVAREAADLIESVAREAVGSVNKQPETSDELELPRVELGEAIQSLYDDRIIGPELYIGLLVFTGERAFPKTASPQTTAGYIRMTREYLRKQVGRLTPDQPEYPRYMMRLLISSVDGGGNHSFRGAVEQFQASSKIDDYETAERIYQRLIGGELLRLFSRPLTPDTRQEGTAS